MTAARAALERRDVTGVLRWVLPEREAEVRDAFTRTLQVRTLGGEAQALADTWFFETLVRIHRAGEGAPFVGLQPGGQIAPVLGAADRTLETGAVDGLVDQVTGHAAAGIRERFARARTARADADTSVDAGRRYVAAYVEYLHYVEGLHLAAAREGGAHEATASAGGHQHEQ